MLVDFFVLFAAAVIAGSYYCFKLTVRKLAKGIRIRKLKIVTITGPSGAGKTTIVKGLLERHPEWRMIASLTTRSPRPSDLPGEYRCEVLKDEFFWRNRKGEFIWMIHAHGNMYGTLLADINEAFDSDNLSVMQITPDVVEKLHKYAPGRICSLYVIPPGDDELRARLKKRGESGDAIDRRIADCASWNDAARHSPVPYFFVENDGTVGEAIYKAEKAITG